MSSPLDRKDIRVIPSLQADIHHSEVHQAREYNALYLGVLGNHFGARVHFQLHAGGSVLDESRDPHRPGDLGRPSQ